MWTADIDVGGTLTDGIFTRNGQTVCVKVDSTPHDLTVCLFDCLTQAATRLGFEGAREFLEQVELIRWSTTITSNVLAEGHGPKIGLLVSCGHERDLYSDLERSPVLDRLLGEREVIGIEAKGGEEAEEEEVMSAARFLLESGARRICVSLPGAHRDAARELRIKHIIDEQYPDHFLGSVPVLAGSDISSSADAATRTACALINAYTHGALAATLFKAEDELRQTCDFRGSFLVSHINGGVAGVGKTKAIDTIESGPILGLHASRFLARTYGLGKVIALDVGGTTAKVGVLRGGEPVLRKPSDFFGIPVGISLPYLRSIALGGGSVIKVTQGDADSGLLGWETDSMPGRGPGGPRDSRPGGRRYVVELGPESMGSFPGPACYGLGGDQPTLTDAFVAAGLIDPEYFLGGAKPIDAELARRTIEESVARPLEVSFEKVCAMVIDQACENVAQLIREAGAELGEDLSQYTLFAYGGNGGLLACGVAERAGLNAAQFFSLGPVFSAFGSSVSDLLHVYERSLPANAVSPEGMARLCQLVEEMKRESIQDLLGEQVAPHVAPAPTPAGPAWDGKGIAGGVSTLEGVVYEIEIDVSISGRPSIPVAIPESAFHSAAELRQALATTAGSSGAELAPEAVRLRARKLMTKPELACQPRSLQPTKMDEQAADRDSVARAPRPRAAKLNAPVQGEDPRYPQPAAGGGRATFSTERTATELWAPLGEASATVGCAEDNTPRRIFWGSRGGEAQILRWESLRPGEPVPGPAVLEGEQTTYFIPEGWTMSLDHLGNGQVGRREPPVLQEVSSTRKAHGDAAA